jgi:hypothetical protein
MSHHPDKSISMCSVFHDGPQRQYAKAKQAVLEEMQGDMLAEVKAVTRTSSGKPRGTGCNNRAKAVALRDDMYERQRKVVDIKSGLVRSLEFDALKMGIGALSAFIDKCNARVMRRMKRKWNK